MKKTLIRWLPAVVVPAVVVGAAITVPLAAGAEPNLPNKTAKQVLEMIADSDVQAFSGTVEQTTDLGLPELPSTGSNSGDEGIASALELVTGSHTMRVFAAGADQLRVQVLDNLAERDAIRNGDDLWLYDSSADEATHATLPDLSSGLGSGAHADLPGTPATPAQLADKLLGAIDASTAVTVDDAATIAGRSAYVITLTPRSADTLVGSASLAVDSETGMPLAVTIEAKGQDEPAVSVAFTAIDFTTPEASLFDFTPPASAKVTEAELPTGLLEQSQSEKSHSGKGGSSLDPTVSGEGWSSIVELRLPEGALDSGAAASDTADSDTAGSDASAMLDQLTTPVDGGRVLQTSLLSVLLTDDGRVLLGAVPASALQTAAQ